MEAYYDFADVYDVFMDGTPYEKWTENIIGFINKYGISKSERENTSKNPFELEKNLIVDLGCGTGIISEMLYKKGFDVIGIDYSERMLEKAFERKEKSGSDILYLNQDMRALDLFSTAGCFISICDCVNYITEPSELLECFKLVNNFLFPGGVFIFDFNTEHKYRDVIGDATIAEKRDECAFIWDNTYYEDEHINEYDLTFFSKAGENYRRFDETHFQRGYTMEEMVSLVKEAGLSIVHVCDADTLKPATEESERVYIVSKECVKKCQN